MDYIYANKKFINLRNVIYILLEDNALRMKFFFPYTVRPFDKDVSGVSIVYYDTIEEYEEAKRKLYIHISGIDYFIEPPYQFGHHKKLINKNHISTIRFDDRHLRIIFNFINSITMNGRGNERKIVTEYAYVDYENFDDAEYALEKVLDSLGISHSNGIALDKNSLNMI